MSLLLLARTGGEVRALADELTERHSIRCFPAAIDVTDAAALDRVILHVEQHLGAVDLLVNNAGIIESAEKPFAEADSDEMWRVIETNLRGPMLLTRALLPAMIARGRGHVVNITSHARAASQTGTYTGYAVAKRALSIFTESIAPSLAGTGVVVIDVLPGLVKTPMTEAMPVWADVTDWDPAAATATVVADIARGNYDAYAGTVIDAVKPPQHP